MNFILDNNLPPRLARALNELSREHTVTYVRKKFSARASDEEWIRQLGAEGGWTIISGDLRISRNTDELRAWQESGLTIFFLEPGWSRLEFWEKASKMIRWWPKIVAQAETVSSQVGYRVPVRSGKLRILSVR